MTGSPTLGRFLQTDPIGYADQYNLYAYVGNDPINGRDPSGKCRNRDREGKCIVRNRAGAAGSRLAGETQRAVRSLDHRIRALSPDANIAVKNNAGEVIRNVTGRELQREWARTSWNIVPEGRQSGISPMGVVNLAVDQLEGHASYAENHGSTREAGIGTVAMHEVSHNTDLGRELTRDFNTRDNSPTKWTPGFITRETQTNWIGRAIGEALDQPDQPYVCTIFDPGC